MAVNRQPGVTATNKSVRYSDGAKALEGCGEVMLPTTGPNGLRVVLGLTDIAAEHFAGFPE